MKIRPLGAELFHADRWTDRRTDMMKVIVIFCNFANALKITNFDHRLTTPFITTSRGREKKRLLVDTRILEVPVSYIKPVTVYSY